MTDSSDRLSRVRLSAIFLKIGSIGFGGGMAVIALMEDEFVQRRKLVSADEFVHGVGLGQILGSFAVNAAFFIGYRLCGLAGGILSAGAFLLPSLVLVTVLSHLYFRYHSIPALEGAVAGLGPVVIALILAAGWSVGRKVLRSWTGIAIAAGALVAGAMKINTVWVLMGAGAVGLFLSWNGRPGRQSVRAVNSRRSLAPSVLLPAMLGSPLLVSIAATFLKIGLVFFGGGFVLIPVLHDRLVTDLGWLSARQFLDGVAISSLTPGPIAVLATFAGYHLAGVPGAIAATAALFAPAIVLMLVISRQYERWRDNRRAQRFLVGVNPAVVGLVLSAAYLLSGTALLSWRGWVLTGIALFLLVKLRWHPAFVLALGAAAGYSGVLP